MVIFLVLVLTVVPLLLGALVTRPIKKDYCNHICFWYVAGMLLMVAMLQLVCIPFIFLQLPFHTLAVFFDVLLVILSALSLWKNQDRIRAVKIGGKKYFRSLFWVIAVILIIIQIATSVFLTPLYEHSGDDVTYITMANDTVETDRIYRTDFMTGCEQALTAVSPKYTLTSFILFTSYLAKISGLHVLTVCKTILPFFWILLAYMIAGLLGDFLLKGDSGKNAAFLCFLSVLNLFFAFSNYTLSFRLLVCSWQGKAWLAVIVLPFLFYYASKIFREGYCLWEMLFVLVLMFAGASGSLFGLVLAPLMLMVLALVYAVEKKNIRILIHSALCCAPSAFYVVIYMFYDRLAALIH